METLRSLFHPLGLQRHQRQRQPAEHRGPGDGAEAGEDRRSPALGGSLPLQLDDATDMSTDCFLCGVRSEVF
eukprot:766882-Hanusia_phi.AAC.1